MKIFLIPNLHTKGISLPQRNKVNWMRYLPRAFFSPLMCVIYSLKSKLSSDTIIRKIFYEWDLSNWQPDAFATGVSDPAVVATQKEQGIAPEFPGGSLFLLPPCPLDPLPPPPVFSFLDHVIQLLGLWAHCVGLDQIRIGLQMLQLPAVSASWNCEWLCHEHWQWSLRQTLTWLMTVTMGCGGLISQGQKA